MSKNTLKLKTETMEVSSRRAIIPPGCENKPEKAVCPHCKKPKRKRWPCGDLIQYGFTWDEHWTVFQCYCNKFFFVQYKVWHAEEEYAHGETN